VRSKISEALSGTLLCDIICAEAPLQPCRTDTQSTGKIYALAGQPLKARVKTTAYKTVTKKCHRSKLPASKKVKRRLIIQMVATQLIFQPEVSVNTHNLYLTRLSIKKRRTPSYK
jgi:hypothetical protein